MSLSQPDARALRARFLAHFGASPRLFRAPGRINLIGEHTDYNEGFVLPAAIDRFCLAAAAPNGRNALRIASANMLGERVVSVDSFVRAGDWSDYVAGVYFALKDAGAAMGGFDVMIDSAVPIGAGVSSSAALEIAAGLAFAALCEDPPPPETLVRAAWAGERDYVGVPCGPMDQFIAFHGGEHALLLDCRTLTYRSACVPKSAAFVVIDSGVRHHLVDGGYRERRADCEAAAALLGASALRDATREQVEACALPDRLRRRARHVVTENERCLAAAAALIRADLRTLGALMTQSHESLRVDFEVTCAETDAITRLAQDVEGVFGARQMGGGFGGAVLALTDSARPDVCGEILDAYRVRTGRALDGFVCRVAGGAGEVEP